MFPNIKCSFLNDFLQTRALDQLSVKSYGLSKFLHFSWILDGEKKANRLTYETSNLQCSMDIDNLEMDEVRELTEFIEDAQKNIL